MANTEVILKKPVVNLGSEADVVKVRAGFARNFLIPNGMAMEATSSNKRHIERLKSLRIEREAQELAEAEKAAAKIKRLKLKFTLSVGQGGKAFGSVTQKDIAKAILDSEAKLDIGRHDIQLEAPIKGTGKFEVPIKLHDKVSVIAKITVSAEGAPEPQ